MRLYASKTFTAVMYILSFILLALFISFEFVLNFSANSIHLLKIITAISIFIFGAAATLNRCKALKNSKLIESFIKKSAIVYFFVYCFIITNFTLFDGTFGREFTGIFSNSKAEILEYFNENTNFVPFHTVLLFIKGYIKGVLTFESLAENLFGNIIAFMPLALFLPVIYKPFNKWRNYLSACSLFIIVIETLQMLFLTGSADIDDFLLNILGCTISFALLKFFQKKKIQREEMI